MKQRLLAALDVIVAMLAIGVPVSLLLLAVWGLSPARKDDVAVETNRFDCEKVYRSSGISLYLVTDNQDEKSYLASSHGGFVEVSRRKP